MKDFGTVIGMSYHTKAGLALSRYGIYLDNLTHITCDVIYGRPISFSEGKNMIKDEKHSNSQQLS